MLKDSLSSVSVLTGLSLLLAALVLVGASQDALNISFSALFDEEYRDIWLNIRLPRVLLAVWFAYLPDLKDVNPLHTPYCRCIFFLFHLSHLPG